MNAVADQKTKAWMPATSCKVPDNIVSSEFALQKVFVPSYEKDKRPCIEQLLTNEYQRIWWQEKETWDKIHSKKVATKKLLRRMVIKKKTPAIPVIIIPRKIRKPKNKKEKETAETVKKTEQTSQKEQKEQKSPKQEEKRTEKTVDKVEELA